VFTALSIGHRTLVIHWLSKLVLKEHRDDFDCTDIAVILTESNGFKWCEAILRAVGKWEDSDD
jgi:hypothetical protein